MKPFYRSFWQENDQTLIEAVKKYPFLFKKCGKKTKQDVKQNCWEAIGTEIGISANRCKYRWIRLKNEYIRSKQNNTKHDDSTLSFLDPEIEVITKTSADKILHSKMQKVDEKSKVKGNSTISANKLKNTTIISEDDLICLTSSDDDEFTELDDSSVKLFENVSPSSSYVNISKTDVFPHVAETDVSRPQSTKSSQIPTFTIPQESKIAVFGAHRVKINKTNEKPEVPEVDDTLINSNSYKIFKPSSSNSSQPQICTTTILPDECSEYKPVLIPKNEIPTDESCKDIKAFFNDLSSYITSRFSVKKQKEIQLQIFTVLTSAELKRYK